MDENTARWARVAAARADTSVSQWIGELVRRHMEREESYDAASRAYQQVEPEELKARGERYPRRTDLHERPGR